MRSKLTFTFLSLFITLITFSQPKIEFNEKEHDFGNVIEGTYPTTYFIFYNTGDKDLVLKEVHASCGCTSPSWPKEAIKPGDSGAIKVVFNTRGYKNKDFMKSVMVTSNIIKNKNNQMDALIIKGHVKPENYIEQYPLEASVAFYNFKAIEIGKKAKGSFILYNNGDSVINVLEFRLESGYDISFKMKPETINPKDSAMVSFVFNAKDMQVGDYNEKLKIITNQLQTTTRNLSIKGMPITARVVSKEEFKKLKEKEVPSGNKVK